MSIFVIRHGETDSNAAGVVQLPDARLSERGVEQAALLARRLAGLGVERILASDLARAAMTAEQIRDATGVEIESEPLLQERNFGEFRGRGYAEIGIDIFAPDVVPPAGESWAAFYSRVERAWARVQETAAETPGNLAVVTHGLVCRVVTERHLPLPAGSEPPTRWGNTSLTIVDSAPPWKVRLLNCLAHLDEASADDPAARSGM